VPWSELVDVAACCLVRSAWIFSDSLGAAGASAAVNRWSSPSDSSKPWPSSPSVRASSAGQQQMWLDDESQTLARRAFVEPDKSGQPLPAGTSGRKMSARAAYERVLAAEASASRLQAEVAQYVAELGLELEEEYVDEKTGYSIDIFIAGYRCAIEVDGPFHYIANGKSQLGSTVMKHRLLRQGGMLLVVVPFFEWNSLNAAPGDSNYNKLAYLRAKLEAVLPSSHDWPQHLPAGFNPTAADREESPVQGGASTRTVSTASQEKKRRRMSAGRDKARESLRGRQPNRSALPAITPPKDPSTADGDYFLGGDASDLTLGELSVDYVAERD